MPYKAVSDYAPRDLQFLVTSIRGALTKLYIHPSYGPTGPDAYDLGRRVLENTTRVWESGIYGGPRHLGECSSAAPSVVLTKNAVILSSSLPTQPPVSVALRSPAQNRAYNDHPSSLSGSPRVRR